MMNPFLEDDVRDMMVKSIKENFFGKVCTILTESCAVPFKDPMDHSKYYSGIMVGVDRTGVWLKHPLYGTLAFFSFPLQGIVQEQTVSPGDPKFEKIKEEITKKDNLKVMPAGKPKPPQQAGNSFISVDEISARLKASK